MSLPGQGGAQDPAAWQRPVPDGAPQPGAPNAGQGMSTAPGAASAPQGSAQPGSAPQGSAPEGSPAGAPAVIEMRGVSRIYDMGALQVAALRKVDVTVSQGEFVAIVGPSGSGKTTLMNLIGCLDRPTTGTYRLGGQLVAGLDDDALAQVRSRMIGFIFQSFNLLPRTSALENVSTPLLYQGVPRKERIRRATAALERLGLGDRLAHEPSELSGGQQQRVAIARALVTEPRLLLADEPTGNLDSTTGHDVMSVLKELHASGRTIVLITHDPNVAANASRQIHVLDGRIVQ